MNILKLNNQALSELPSSVSRPSYDRSKIKTGIVHVGIGGFHRSHQAYYLDQLLEQNDASYDWGICGVSLLEGDAKIHHVLQRQDGLYTLTIKNPEGTFRQIVIGSLVEYLFGIENPQQVIHKMAEPDVKIISLTITEGGYNYNESTESFDFENPLIQHDLSNHSQPKTIFGYLTQALKIRKRKGLNGVTIQSCDNIQGNGKMAKKMLLSYIEKAEPELLELSLIHI